MPSFLRTLALATLVAAPLAAQGSREQLLVSPKWLNDHVKDANVVVLQVGDKAAYDQAHIPNARFVTLRQIMVQQDSATRLTTELPPVDSLRAAFARLGISDDSRVIVSFTSGALPLATRTILTLEHAGLGSRASLLDGGTHGWTGAGFAMTADVPAAKEGSLSPLRTRQVMVPAEFVRDSIGKPGVIVIDARNGGYYDGVQESGPSDARRKGHIKGAVSVPYNSIIRDNFDLKSAEELQAQFTEAGVKPGDTIVGYCHVGQQATLMLFAARTLGYKVFLYDGSFEDWARRDWPVAVPPAK